MKNRKTTPILDGTYEVIGLVPGPCGSVLGMVDLSKINSDTAEKLVQAGFPYLRKKVTKRKPRPSRSKNKTSKVSEKAG